MKVVIKEKEYEYESDYPEGWQYSAGDPFKFPISIGNYTCFIKRFEKKTPEDITGWDLLQKLKGRYEPHLVRLYDILNVQENGKDVYYLFFEYLEGSTLDKMVSQKASIDLKRLTNDLFIAIRSLQNNGFWFVDFFERNIFCDQGGSYLLVDLDSTHPINEAPQNDMYGNKDYWILVFKFYQQVLQNTSIKLSDINGISFNYIQIAFLVLRLKLHREAGSTDYNASAFYEKLPMALDEFAPQLKAIFTIIYQNKQQLLTDDDIQRIKQIIERDIIPSATKKQPLPVKSPVIKHFSSDKTKLKDKAHFTLSWEITDWDRVELYKNNAVLKQFSNQETKTTLVESFDDAKLENVYNLVAYNGANSVRSDTITIRKVKHGIGFLLLKILAWIVGIIVFLYIAAVVITMLSHGQDFSTQTEKAYEDSVVVIESKKTIDPSRLQVSFDNVKAIVKSSSDSTLTVSVPDLNDTTAGDLTARISVVEDSKEVFSASLPYVRKVRIYKLSSGSFYGNTPVTITGKNLNIEDLQVYFNDKQALVNSKYSKMITAMTPDLKTFPVNQNVNLSVISGGKSLFMQSYKIRNIFTSLTDNASSAVWTAGVLAPDQYSMASSVTLDWQNSDSDSRGFARVDYITMEDGNAYWALRTHPMWLPQGSISGKFRELHIPGKKIFKAKIGFRSFANIITAAPALIDGVEYQVWLHYKLNDGPTNKMLFSQHKNVDHTLVDVSVDFPADVPDNFSIELKVNAGPHSENDWACWITTAIVSKKLTILKPSRRPRGPF
jgi:hypothetical protein